MVWQYKTGAYFMHVFNCYWIHVINNEQLEVLEFVKIDKDIFDVDYVELTNESTKLFLSERHGIKRFKLNSTTETLVGQWQTPEVSPQKCGNKKCTYLCELFSNKRFLIQKIKNL